MAFFYGTEISISRLTKLLIIGAASRLSACKLAGYAGVTGSSTHTGERYNAGYEVLTWRVSASTNGQNFTQLQIKEPTMNWLFFKRPDSSSRNKKTIYNLQNNKTRKANPKAVLREKSSKSSKFRAVRVQWKSERACNAALETLGQVFLCREAPWLPLPECDRTSCQCRYEHLEDRRTELRRDSDNGLPDRVVEHDRRRKRERRQHRTSY